MVYTMICYNGGVNSDNGLGRGYNGGVNTVIMVWVGGTMVELIQYS